MHNNEIKVEIKKFKDELDNNIETNLIKNNI